MDPEPDVQAEPSPAPEDASTPSHAASSVLESTDVVVEDRPLKNLQAEFNRKLSRVEQQYQDLTAMVQQALQAQAKPAPAGPLDQYTNEQLAQLAQAGSAEAQQELTRRMVQAQVQAQSAIQNRVMELRATHQALYTRYPQLNDPSHPLTQYAM